MLHYIDCATVFFFVPIFETNVIFSHPSYAHETLWCTIVKTKQTTLISYLDCVVFCKSATNRYAKRTGGKPRRKKRVIDIEYDTDEISDE